MQDADVPLWDKGDNTDNYAKGGSSGFSLFGREDQESKNEEVEKAYDLVLGRKPTSRELSYYRYSSSKFIDIVKKLLKGDEHKDLVEKGRKYGDLESQQRLSQSTILKLKQGVEDQVGEINEMRAILDQKNREIAVLREEKRIPYVTQSFLEGKGVVYYTNTQGDEKNSVTPTPISWLDRLSDIIKKISK